MASLRNLDPRVYRAAAAFVSFLERCGVTVTVTSTLRDMDQQRRLYADYRAGRTKYPVAPPGHSQHALGLAFDLHLDPPVYLQAGRIWEAAGFTWGGRFQDQIHFDFRRR